LTTDAVVQAPPIGTTDVDLIVRIQDSLKIQIFPVHDLAAQALRADVNPHVVFSREQIADPALL
jgi:hypothetical protein